MNLLPLSKNDLLQSPALLDARYSARAWKMNVASKAAAVGIAAIALATTSVFIFGLTLSGATPFFFVGSLLSTVLLMVGGNKANRESIEAAKLAGDEKAIGEIQHQFQALYEDEYNSVCANLSLDPANSPYSKEEFNFLVSRLAFSSKQAQTALEKSHKHIYVDYPESELKKLRENAEKLKATPEEVSLFFYKTRKKGFDILENEALPAMLRSAQIFQILNNANQAPSLEPIGTYYPKKMSVRISEQTFEQNDVYMTFKDASRPPLTREEIIRLYNIGLSALHQRLFG